jgi:hypothetical protein
MSATTSTTTTTTAAKPDPALVISKVNDYIAKAKGTIDSEGNVSHKFTNGVRVMVKTAREYINIYGCNDDGVPVVKLMSLWVDSKGRLQSSVHSAAEKAMGGVDEVYWSNGHIHVTTKE